MLEWQSGKTAHCGVAFPTLPGEHVCLLTVEKDFLYWAPKDQLGTQDTRFKAIRVPLSLFWPCDSIIFTENWISCIVLTTHTSLDAPLHPPSAPWGISVSFSWSLHSLGIQMRNWYGGWGLGVELTQIWMLALLFAQGRCTSFLYNAKTTLVCRMNVRMKLCKWPASLLINSQVFVSSVYAFSKCL